MIHNILIADDSKVLTIFIESIVKSIEGCETIVVSNADKDNRCCRS